MSTLAGRSLLFVVNTEWFFVSHRLPLARAALEANARVTLAAGGDGEALRATAEGRAIRFVPTPLSRSGVNPLRELGGVLTLRRLYQRERPDLVHHVTSKPVIYGSLAARGLPLTVLNAVSGLGYAFTGRGSSPRRAVLRATMQRLYRAALHRPRTYTVFQNQDDLELFIGLGLVDAASTLMIRGSGVDCRRFAPRPEPPASPWSCCPPGCCATRASRSSSRPRACCDASARPRGWCWWASPTPATPARSRRSASRPGSARA